MGQVVVQVRICVGQGNIPGGRWDDLGWLGRVQGGFGVGTAAHRQEVFEVLRDHQEDKAAAVVAVVQGQEGELIDRCNLACLSCLSCLLVCEEGREVALQIAWTRTNWKRASKI